MPKGIRPHAQRHALDLMPKGIRPHERHALEGIRPHAERHALDLMLKGIRPHAQRPEIQPQMKSLFMIGVARSMALPCSHCILYGFVGLKFLNFKQGLETKHARNKRDLIPRPHEFSFQPSVQLEFIGMASPETYRGLLGSQRGEGMGS